MKKTAFVLAAAVLTAAICLSGFQLWKISQRYSQEARVKESVMDYRPGMTAGPTGGLPEQKHSNPQIMALQNDVNGDIVGWLSIPGTRIDYPFVGAANNDYYLKRDLYGNYAEAGSIFMDYRCARELRGFNTILYGHNMLNDSMFGGLLLFAGEEFFDSHPSGTVFLKNQQYTLEIFACMIVNADDKVVYSTYMPRDEFLEYTCPLTQISIIDAADKCSSKAVPKPFIAIFIGQNLKPLNPGIDALDGNALTG